MDYIHSFFKAQVSTRENSIRPAGPFSSSSLTEEQILTMTSNADLDFKF